jgi:predicted CoA-binding protein
MNFFDLQVFAVVGASNDRNKFGNKVLRSYLQNALNAVPINTRQTLIEGRKCVESLTALLCKTDLNLGFDPSQIGVSIITPPGVTKLIIEEGVSLGIKNYFLQPGTYDWETNVFIENIKLKNSDVNIHKGCVLIDLGFSDL